nr:hypothetical protein [Candidatus Magasanikbacteria bacterium]
MAKETQSSSRFFSFVAVFRVPLAVMVCLLVTGLALSLGFVTVAAITAIVAAILGGMDSVRDMIESIKHKQFALDYIALLAIIVGLFTGHYVVVALIALMLSGGKTLE